MSKSKSNWIFGENSSPGNPGAAVYSIISKDELA
jgi:hypothetical protein